MKTTSLRKAILYAGVFCTVFSATANATLKEAIEAMNDQDYTFALSELNRLIEKGGEPDAKFYLGRLYENGYGVQKDKILALKLYQEAAESGSSKAALKIGNAYYTGKGLDKNYVEAFNWYKKAAVDDNFAAFYNLGLMYEEGVGIKKDLLKAFENYKNAAEKGYEPAQLALGKMYLKGLGTPQDFTEAVFWHKLAADQGDTKAQMDLAGLYANTSIRGLPFNIVGAHVYYNLVSAYGKSPLKEEAALKRDEMTGKMKNEDVIIAQKKAQRWKKRTRKESLPQLFRGRTLLEEEEGAVRKNEKTQASSQEEEIPVTAATDNEEILVAAGISRRDISKAVRSNDFTEIVTALTEKADAGNEIAILALGGLYTLGQGMPQDYKAAISWFKKAADKKNAIAFYKLAPLYCEGNGVEPDLAVCYQYMLLAQKYTDEASKQTIDEALKMLDDNLEQPIRDDGKKLFDAYVTAPKEPKKDKKDAKKSGFLSSVFGSDEQDAMEKPKDTPEKEEKKTEPEKKDPPEKEEKSKKEQTPADEEDLFSGL